MRIAVVTGSTGFVGGHVCRALLDGGWTVRALVRAGRHAPAGSTEVQWGDFRDGATLRHACDGADVLVHAAGVAHVFHASSRDRHQTTLAVREAASLAASAASAAGVHAVVLVSSIAAAVGRDEYADGKRAVEHVMIETLAGKSTQLLTLRPPMIYGEGMRGRPLRLFEMVARNRLIPLAGVANRRSVAYVGNVADCVRRLCDGAANGPPIVYPADSTAMSTEDLVRKIAGSLHIPARVVRVPLSILRTAGLIGTLSRGWLSPVTLEDVLRATGTLVVDSMPDFTPYGPARFSTDEGLARSATWFRSR